MKRRAFLLAAGALGIPLSVEGQSSNPPRIGAVIVSRGFAQFVVGLRAGLKELGLAEGKDFVLDVFYANADTKAMEEAARRFEREQVRLIYAASSTAAVAVKRATSKVPIVFCAGTDPVALGLIDNFAKPGGNATGVHHLTGDLTAKRLELLRDLLPKLRRVVTFYNPDNPAARRSAQSARQAATSLGIRLVEHHSRSEAELRQGLAALKPGDADAFFMISDTIATTQSRLLIDATKAARMPLMAQDQAVVERGALLSYGADYREVGRYSAKYVQRVLAGAKPADLPVENVTHLVFVLNRRTARELGVAVPPAMLVRFDRVIE
jgi:putative ABC transport system substrate-binding protein